MSRLLKRVYKHSNHFNSVFFINVATERLKRRLMKKEPFTSLHKINVNLPHWAELELLQNGVYLQCVHEHHAPHVTECGKHVHQPTCACTCACTHYRDKVRSHIIKQILQTYFIFRVVTPQSKIVGTQLYFIQ